jgi:hypothetical protein
MSKVRHMAEIHTPRTPNPNQDSLALCLEVREIERLIQSGLTSTAMSRTTTAGPAPITPRERLARLEGSTERAKLERAYTLVARACALLARTLEQPAILGHRLADHIVLAAQAQHGLWSIARQHGFRDASQRQLFKVLRRLTETKGVFVANFLQINNVFEASTLPILERDLEDAMTRVDDEVALETARQDLERRLSFHVRKLGTRADHRHDRDVIEDCLQKLANLNQPSPRPPIHEQLQRKRMFLEPLQPATKRALEEASPIRDQTELEETARHENEQTREGAA